MAFDGLVQPASNADMTGAAYQFAKSCISRDSRDYLWFYARNNANDSGGYYLLFADNLGDSGGQHYHPLNQSVYYFEHVVIDDPDNPQDYWTCNYIPDTHLYVEIPSGVLAYGSPEAFPDLRGVSEHYAYTFLLLGLACCFALCSNAVTCWLYRRR